jgi:hypothetical protein
MCCPGCRFAWLRVGVCAGRTDLWGTTGPLRIRTSKDVEELFRIGWTFESRRDLTDEEFGTLQRRLGPITALILRAAKDGFGDKGKFIARCGGAPNLAGYEPVLRVPTTRALNSSVKCK